MSRHVTAVAAVASALALLLVATACGAQAKTVPISFGVDAAAATPTLPGEGEELEQYLPLLIQGIWLPPTPTATAGPYDSPPGSMSYGLEVLSAKTSQRAADGRYLLDMQGEVSNGGGRRAKSIRVVFVARSGNEQCGRGALTLLGQESAILRPGDLWPFAGTAYIGCAAQEVALEVVAVETDTTPLRLSVGGATVGATSGGDWMLSGTLTNSSSVTVSYPRAVVTLHDAAGAYVASGLAYAEVTTLSPGETTAFAVVISAANASGWASYAVVGTGEII